MLFLANPLAIKRAFLAEQTSGQVVLAPSCTSIVGAWKNYMFLGATPKLLSQNVEGNVLLLLFLISKTPYDSGVACLQTCL